MRWATPEEKLLAKETIQKVLQLLEQGFSRRQIAEQSHISVWSVQKIINGKRSNIRRAKAVLDCFANTVNSECYIPLELRGDVMRRYLDVRKQKEKQELADNIKHNNKYWRRADPQEVGAPGAGG